MTLTIHTEQDEQRQLLMTIEVPEERVEKQMRKTARKLARDINFPGFRRGRVPYNVLVRRVGRETLRSEAVEEMLPSVFEEALEEVQPDMYARANFDDMEMEPLVLKFTIPLEPEVTLGDYRSLRKEIEPVEITEEALEEALEHIRTHHQVLEEVDRPVQAGDMVTVSGIGELVTAEDEAEADEADEYEMEEEETGVDGDEDEDEGDEELTEAETDNVIFNEERIDLVMDSEKLFAGTSFVENIIGLSVGDETSFTVTFPEDFENETLAGKEATFDITVLNVQNRELPELDDELAQKEGDYKTFEELREATRERLQEQAEIQAKNELIEGMVDDLLESAAIIFPPAAVELEIDDMLENFKQQVTRSGWRWEDFLQIQSTQESDLRENFRENAAERLNRRLVLRQFVIDEKLTIEEEDIEATIDERVNMFGDNEELVSSMREYYRTGSGFDMLSSEILIDKAHERIVAILKGEAPDLEALAAEAEAEADSDVNGDEGGDTAVTESDPETETESESDPVDEITPEEESTAAEDESE